MLDFTGIKSFERPELRHLVAHAARCIENALTIGQIKGQYDLLVRLNCPSRLLDDQTMVWFAWMPMAMCRLPARCPDHDA